MNVNYETLMERYRELLEDYERKCNHLDNAYQSLNGLSERLSSLMVTKLFRIIEKKSTEQLTEGFKAISSVGEQE